MTATSTNHRMDHWLHAAVGALLLGGLSLTIRIDPLFFHTLAEFFSIVVAYSVFVLFWNSRRFLDHGAYLVLGIAYLFVGSLDLLHTLAYKGMNVLPVDGSDPATQLWIAARFVEAGSLLAAPWLLRRRINPYLGMAAYAAVTGLVLALIFVWDVFPTCFVDGPNGGLTPFKKATEYVICLMLAGALVFVHRRRAEIDAAVYRLLVASIAVMIASELCFTFYSDPYSPANVIGHLLKIVSFYFVYRAFVEIGLTKPYALLFRELNQSITDEKLARTEAERTQQLLFDHQRRQRERVEAELARVKNQLVRQTRLATIGQIVAGIAHDLRNPLGVIHNAAWCLRRQVKEDPKPARYLEIIETELETTSRIINNLMEAVRAKEPAREPTDFGQAVAEVFARVENRGEIRCQIDCRPDPFIVSADPVQLRQVLGNLLNNAADAMRGGGEIHVQAREIDDNQLIVIRDNGPGIPPEIRDTLFEPLVTTRHKGTGLGLAICRQIVERHGGVIQLVDYGEGGAAFEILLPRAAASESVRSADDKVSA